MKQLEVARLFSSGKFEQVASELSDQVKFHLHEDDQRLIGRATVLEFCCVIGEYSTSVDTDFRESVHLISGDQVVIYGDGEVKRGGKLFNALNSCDIYKFGSGGLVEKIHSFCNVDKE